MLFLTPMQMSGAIADLIQRVTALEAKLGVGRFCKPEGNPPEPAAPVATSSRPERKPIKLAENKD